MSARPRRVRVHAYTRHRKRGRSIRARGPARGLSGLCIRGDYLWAPRVRVRTPVPRARVCVCMRAAKSFSGSGLVLFLSRRFSLSLSFSRFLSLSCVYVCRTQGYSHTRATHTHDSRVLASPGFDRTAHVCARELVVCVCVCTRAYIGESGINPGLLVVCAPPAVQIQNPTHTTQLILTLPSRPHLALPSRSRQRIPVCALHRQRPCLVYRVYLEVRVR